MRCTKGAGSSRPQALRIDTQHLPGKDASALWQDEFVPYWEVRPVRSPEEKFPSSAEIHQFGEMALGTVRTPAQWIDRSRYRVACDGFTQFGIQFVRQGHIGKRDAGAEALASEPGDVLISDLSQCSTLAAYVREKRLHQVREALGDPRNRARSNAEIAEDAGFGNYAAFARAFRNAFEMSPRELRALTGKRPWSREQLRSNAWSEWLLQTR